MNFRPASLVCGIVLIVAVPVLADRMPNSGFTNDSAYAGIHAGANNDAVVRDAQSSRTPDPLFASSLDKHGHSVNLSDLGSFGRAYSTSDSEKAWGKERDRDGDNDRDQKKGAAPIAVPEPGSLWHGRDSSLRYP